MRLRWLGWAGVELEVEGHTLVIDALDDAAAVFAPFGDRSAGMPVPEVVEPTPGKAVAALVTHLHRDHADAGAIGKALVGRGPLLEPHPGGGEPLEELGLAQAEHELSTAGFQRVRVAPWDTIEVEPFIVTALPAADGTGDPQLSWAVESDGVRILHLGDTMFHGYWWRMALRHGPFDVVLAPVNGPAVDFPHRQPASSLPIAMTAEQAAVAAGLLRARVAMPIHAEGYEVDGIYEPGPDAAARFAGAARDQGVEVRLPELGAPIELEPVEVAA